MEQLGSHWTDIHEILFLKSPKKIKVSLTSDKNSMYFTRYITWRPRYIYISILV